MTAIRKVLASFRSDGQRVTEEDLQAAWVEYDARNVVTDEMFAAACASQRTGLSEDRREMLRDALDAAMEVRP